MVVKANLVAARFHRFYLLVNLRKPAARISWRKTGAKVEKIALEKPFGKTLYFWLFKNDPNDEMASIAPTDT